MAWYRIITHYIRSFILQNWSIDEPIVSLGTRVKKKIFLMKDLWSFQPSYVILNKMWQKCYIIAVATLLEFGIIHWMIKLRKFGMNKEWLTLLISQRMNTCPRLRSLPSNSATFGLDLFPQKMSLEALNKVWSRKW